MVDKVSVCLATSLAISDKGKISFGIVGNVALWEYDYIIGRFKIKGGPNTKMRGINRNTFHIMKKSL